MLTGLTLSLALAMAAPPAATPVDRPITHHIEKTFAMPAQPASTAGSFQAGSRDSVKNGAIIGAIVAGAATGAGIALLCHAFNDTGDPQCWKAALLWTGIGAGAGAAIGAGIDALFTRRVTFHASVRF